MLLANNQFVPIYPPIKSFLTITSRIGAIMAVIGIESSAHTLGIGIIEDGKVIANVKRMYPISDKGMIPMRVADFHVRGVRKLLREAFSTAGMDIEDIEAIGYTMGPGIEADFLAGNMELGG